MDIIIQSLGFKAGEKLEAYICEKLDKLEHKGENIIRANVTLFMESDKASANDYCEIRLEVPGNDHFVKKNAGNFEQAVSEAVHTLQEIIHRNKEKELHNRRA